MRFLKVILLAGVALGLSACRLTVTPSSYNLTVDNGRCFTRAVVFIDGRNVGVVPGRGVRSFAVSPGSHSVNVDNDLAGPEVIPVNGDVVWHGSLCA